MYGQQQISEEKIVVIINCAVNPEGDVTRVTPEQCYNLSQVSPKVNVIVK